MNYPSSSQDPSPRGFLARLREKLPQNNSVLLAGGITIALFFWVVSGVLFSEKESHDARAITERDALDNAFLVQVETVYQEDHRRIIQLQGRTEADRHVNLAAETAGAIAKLPVEKGARVKKGDIICQIEVGARAAQLEEARALQESRSIEYQAAKKLFEKGHTSKSQVAAAKAAFDAARASTKMREIELGRTRVRAPFDGIVDRLPLEVGDFISAGGLCAKIIDKDPLLVVAHVSETQVQMLESGSSADVVLATGETTTGKLQYIAESPSAMTRTFQVEIEIPNGDDKLRDGVSADVSIFSGLIRATRIPQTVMTLGDDGAVGVRVVKDGKAKFVAVDVIANAAESAWVTGLDDGADLIVVGQDYIRDGETVTIPSGTEEQGKTLERFSANN
jgi:multidrug efflux system membrane fusion protein